MINSFDFGVLWTAVKTVIAAASSETYRSLLKIGALRNIKFLFNQFLQTFSSCLAKSEVQRRNSMGDEGDDYMGDLSQFLPPDQIAALQTKEKPNDEKGYNRKLNWNEKRKINRKEQLKKEDEQIKTGINSAIPSTNIGFKMLQQMGYNPGVALGKHGQGRLEPVTIEIKRSRTGLGRDHVEKEKKKEKQIKKEREMERIVQKMKRKEARIMAEYEERKKRLWQDRKIVVNYKKAKAALSQLEETKFGHPIEVEMEKELEEDTEETVEDEEEVVTAEDLQEVLNRLSAEFNYCFYCGCQYESEDTLLANCPGTEEEDH